VSATLNGANTYSGGTVLQDQSTLNVGSNTALGTGALVAAGPTGQTLHADVDQTLANPVLLLGPLTTTDTGTLSLTGPIDGPGSLTQAGPGTLALSGNSTYTGGTTVAAGMLAVGSDTALGIGPLTLQTGTTLTNPVPVTLANPILAAGDATIHTGADLTATGPLSGPGDLTKTGPAALTLDGDLSGYTGQLIAAAGTLNLTQPFTADLDVNAGATVNLGNGGNAPGLTAPIAGTLNLGNGSNTLNIPVDQFGQLTGTVNGGTGDDQVNIIHSGEGTWAPGTLTGIERIDIQPGANVLLGDGISRPTDTAQTLVEGGLALNGSLGGHTTVAAGGTLTGHGTVLGNLTVNGTLAPGGIAGATGVLAPVGAVPQGLSVGGTATLNAGSNFIVRTQPDGTSDHLDVAGAATITGGGVTVHPLGTAYGLSTDYTIVNAAGGLTGNFSSVTQADLPFLSASLAATPTHVVLTLARNDGTTNPPGGGGNNPPGGGGNNPPGGGGTNPPGGGNNPPGGGGTNPPGGGNNPPGTGGGSLAYGDFPGLTRNQRSMANGALQDQENREFATGQTSPLEPVLRQVRGLTTDQVKPVFDSLTGESYASTATIAAGSARRDSQAILAAGSQADPGYRGDDRHPSYALTGAWATALGGNRSLDGSQGNADQAIRQRGLAVGLDGELANGVTVGPYLATDRTTFNANRRNDDGTVHQTTVGVRIGQDMDQAWWRGLVGYGWAKQEMDRSLLLPGYTNGRAHGESDGHILQAALEGGWKFTQNDWDWGPVVGLYHTRAQFDGLTEHGENEADLRLGSQSYHETVVSAGVAAGHNWAANGGGTWRVEGSVKGFHNFNADPGTLRAAFAVAPESSFSLVGNPPAKQWVEVGAGLHYALANRWSFSVGYGVALGGRETGHGVNLGVSMAW